MSSGGTVHSYGNVEYRLAPNSIGPIFAGGREIVRRIFVTVRDAGWNEIEPQSHVLEADASAPGTATVGGEHRSKHIDFRWTGRLRVEPDQRELSFSFEGEVLREGQVCRLGLIVLLPPERVQGSGGVIAVEGQRQPVVFGEGLGPQPIVDGLPTGLTEPFDCIELSGTDGGKLTLALEGDLFEIEDQRNWGDASFKIYCTPLARGFPRSVHKGERIAHAVHLRYSLPAEVRTGGQTARLLDPRAFPAIGVVAAAFEGRAKELAWRHVAARPAELAAVGLADAGGIELVLEPADLADDCARVRQTTDGFERVRRILLAGDGVALPDEEHISRLRAFVAARDLAIPIFASTRGWFVEFNRSAALPDGSEGLAWPVAPTVHSRTVATLLENVAPFTPMAAHIRGQARARLAISSLSWGGPGSSEPVAAERGDLLLWCAAALIDAAAAGVESVTLGTDLVRHLAGEPETLAGLARLVALSESPVRPVETGVEGLAALLVAGKDEEGLLVANACRTVESLTLPDEHGGAAQAFSVLARSFAALMLTDAAVRAAPRKGAA
jgi:hypothetical protein